MNADSQQQKSSAAAASGDKPSVTSEELLGETRQLTISHNGDSYTLRITANNKLLLTK